MPPETVNFTFKLDNESVALILIGDESYFGINSPYASESRFNWSIVDELKDWVDRTHDGYQFHTFNDSLAQSIEGQPCLIVLGTLPGAMFFGYQGFEIFFGGSVAPQIINKIIDELLSLRSKITTKNTITQPCHEDADPPSTLRKS